MKEKRIVIERLNGLSEICGIYRTEHADVVNATDKAGEPRTYRKIRVRPHYVVYREELPSPPGTDAAEDDGA